MSVPVMCCSRSGDDEEGMVERSGGWSLDVCEAWQIGLGYLDLEEWDQKRRERLAEAQEY